MTSTAVDAHVLERIAALRLPSLGGLRFLDAACGDGLFCGFALADGATRVVGIERDPDQLALARERFPAAEFAAGGESLPEGPFDVILLASALHLDDDQPGLVRALMSRLAANGMLVLELGLASSDTALWKDVAGSTGNRRFPSLAMLDQVLGDFAWKWIGPSVEWPGDTVRRHVVQVQHRRPLAYLLMQAPGLGKTSIARSLFGTGKVALVSGDQVLLDLAHGRLAASPSLVAAVKDGFSTLSMDRATERVFAAGVGAELVGLWLQRRGEGDLAVDAYVPPAERAAVSGILCELGYLPVELSWTRPGLAMGSGQSVRQRARAFLDQLAAGAVPAAGTPLAGVKGTVGHVDDVRVVDDRVIIRGWAVHASGRMPALLAVRVGRRMQPIHDFERQHRPDVQAHLGLSHDVCGFLAVVPVATLGGDDALKRSWLVYGGMSENSLDGPFGIEAGGRR
jgi:hypothetical protein